jgi:hypothetical protein
MTRATSYWSKLHVSFHNLHKCSIWLPGDHFSFIISLNRDVWHAEFLPTMPGSKTRLQRCTLEYTDLALVLHAMHYWLVIRGHWWVSVRTMSSGHCCTNMLGHCYAKNVLQQWPVPSVTQRCCNNFATVPVVAKQLLWSCSFPTSYKNATDRQGWAPKEFFAHARAFSSYILKKTKKSISEHSRTSQPTQKHFGFAFGKSVPQSPRTGNP